MAGPEKVPLEDAWIFEQLNGCAATVNRALDQHRYHEATQALWDFVWHEFCDWYLEVKKLRFREGTAGWTSTGKQCSRSMKRCCVCCIRFMPFVTEELWQRLKLQGAAESGQPVSISLAHYPKPAARGRG